MQQLGWSSLVNRCVVVRLASAFEYNAIGSRLTLQWHMLTTTALLPAGTGQHSILAEDCGKGKNATLLAILLQMVEQEYAELFPGEVEAVHVVHDLAALNNLVKEYEKLKRNLEDLVDDYTSKKRRHKPFKPKKASQALVLQHLAA